MKFKQFLQESTSGLSAWEKYFKDREVKTFVKKTTPVYTNNKKTDEVIEQGEEVLVPSSSLYNKGKILVLYKGIPKYIQFAALDKQAKKGGEQLKIPANILTKTAQSIESTVRNKTFESKVFYNALDLSTTINNSIQVIKTIPDPLKIVLINYLESGKFSVIDWMGYNNKQHINEIAKYLGELLIGLCILNKEFNVLSKNVFTKKVKKFILPTDSSFAGVDSMFEFIDGTFLPISSKSGKGAPASFHANVMPVLVKNSIKTKSKLLSFMIDIQRQKNLKNLEFIYEIGFKFLMKKDLKGKLGKKVLNSPYTIYNNIRTGNITELEKYVMNVVRNGKWPVMKNQNKIIDKLPNSLTYFICQNIAELLNKDKEAKNTIIEALTAKEFWQANLDKNKFHKGHVYFKMISSGSNNIKVTQGKGSMNSVKSEQGRLNYFIL